jgi:hypothetical protein
MTSTKSKIRKLLKEEFKIRQSLELTFCPVRLKVIYAMLGEINSQIRLLRREIKLREKEALKRQHTVC